MKATTKRKIAAGKRPFRKGLFATAAAQAEWNLDWSFVGAAVPTLFHYTNNMGLMGIIGSSSFWATDAQFLNDAQEIEVALGVARNIVSDHLLQNKAPYAEALGLQIHVHSIQNPASRYIFSLSEDGNSLSQWRGYASQGAGYSIRLDHEQLQAWCIDQGYTLGKVKYTTNSYSECLKDMSLVYVDDLGSYFPFFGSGEINEDVLRI